MFESHHSSYLAIRIPYTRYNSIAMHSSLLQRSRRRRHAERLHQKAVASLLPRITGGDCCGKGTKWTIPSSTLRPSIPLSISRFLRISLLTFSLSLSFSLFFSLSLFFFLSLSLTYTYMSLVSTVRIG